VSDSDLRPRIEHFHDAVRVLMQNPEAMHLPHGRLSVEQLAFDVKALRMIMEKPLVRIDGMPYRKMRSASKDVMDVAGALAVANPPEGMNNAIRSQLGQLYKTYTVMFVALFAESANRNFKTRQEEHNSAVEDLAEVEQMIRQYEAGRVSEAEVEDAVDNVQNPELRHKLMVALHQKTQAKRALMNNLKAFIAAQIKGIDGMIAEMDKAHKTYLTGQMVMLQDSQALVKRFASQGMNLAGQFLANATQAVGKGAGRGF